MTLNLLQINWIISTAKPINRGSYAQRDKREFTSKFHTTITVKRNSNINKDQ